MKPVLIFQFRFIFDSSFISIEKANDRILDSGFLFYYTPRIHKHYQREPPYYTYIVGIIDNTEMEIRRFMTTKVQLKYISAKKKEETKNPKHINYLYILWLSKEESCVHVAETIIKVLYAR